jgi:hypothetical protein
MSTALDAILEHIQKDPMAKYIFQDDDSETSTIIESPPPVTQNNQVKSTKPIPISDNDTQMTMKEQSGTKRHHQADSQQKYQHGSDPKVESSPIDHHHPSDDQKQNPPPTPTITIGSGGDRNVAINKKYLATKPN